MNSKELFHRLMQALTLEESKAEKEAMTFSVMEHELKLSKAMVMAGNEVTINENYFDNIIQRLNRYEPVQYVLGVADFYGRKFFVNPSVLIPRPETEILVKSVINEFQGSKEKITLLDIGTGSGCIAVTLALELLPASVFATDIRSDGLGIAKENSKRLKANVQFQTHDILNDTISMDRLDAVVSNPPYILEKEKTLLPRNVVEYEPAQALFVPDSNPLLFHKAIAEKARLSLNPGGILLTEINERMGNDTAALFESLGYADVKILKDLDRKDRLVVGRNKN